MPRTLTITFSNEDRAKVEPAATALGMKLGPFVRKAALEAAGEIPFSETSQKREAPQTVRVDLDRNNHRDRTPKNFIGGAQYTEATSPER